MKKQRVVVAMSGGVDSSVAAALMVKQGYDVIGLMMRLWSEPSMGHTMNRCCTPDQMADARRIAGNLGIPFYVVDVQDYFRQTIVQFFIDEHTQARTPNPCVECNRHIRFDYLLNHALHLEADYLVTGHYARVCQTPAGYELRKGVDAGKDQSYVLYILGQDILQHVLFPVGNYTKTTVRQMALELNLPVAQKSDSMDLCFLGDGDYRRFLQEHVPDIHTPGPIMNRAGNIVGQHHGLPLYTIGQRKGLGFSAPHPMYVMQKDVRHNALIVGTKEEIGQTQLQVREVNWVSGQMPALPHTVMVKIRYKAREVPATLTESETAPLAVTLHEPVAGITPGQSAVFYQGDVCLGGGIIADYHLL